MRQELNDAAERYAEGIPYNQDRHRHCSKDFIAGAEWMARELWHGANEEPDIKADGSEVDVIFKVNGHDGLLKGTVWIDIEVIGGTPVFTGNGKDYETHEIDAWCYVSDLYELLKLIEYGEEGV